MATLRLLGFSGELPKLLPRLLPDMSAQAAFNVRLDDGALTPVRRSRFTYAFPGGTGESYRSIYRHDGIWLGWDGAVNATPGPVAQDRLYYTGDGPPKLRVAGDVYNLAVPRPGAALAGTASGTGTGDVETRIYTYTFVTQFGEESEPAAPSNEIEWRPGDTVTLSGFEAAPGGRGITKQRIYRSQTGTSAGTGFFLIAERDVSAANFVDDVGPEEFQEPLPSANWHAPPDDLQGLTSLPNGMMAGFVGKDLYFCEPWRPHAYPEEYVLTTDYNIVGLGAFGNSLVVVTEGTPYLVTGTHPASMVMEKLELNLPCINARSIQDLGYAVAYASRDGLVVVSAGGARVATEQTISRTEWLKLNPQTFVSGQFQGRYYASYTYTDAELEEHKGTIIIDLSGELPFIIRSRVSAEAFHYAIEDTALYYLSGGSVFELDSRAEVNETMNWKSKQFVLPRPTNFGAILIEADDALSDDDVQAIQDEIDRIEQENADVVATGVLGGAVNATPVNTYPVNGDAIQIPPTLSQFASVAIYADRTLVALVSDVNQMKRLPSGFLARMWEIEVSGDMRISQVTLATTGAELMTV